MKFRKKPVEVKAEQWFPGKVVAGVREAVGGTRDEGEEPDPKGIRVVGVCVTIHGQETIVEAGDWVITEPDGLHHYPCKPDIFAATYDAV